MNLDNEELSALIRQHATHHAAPDSLRAGIRTQVALAEAARASRPLSMREPWWQAIGWRSAVAGAAFGMALTVLLSTVIVPQLEAQLVRPSLEDELVGDYLRSMGMGPLIEVASSDRHTVKPWFQGKLDYAPPVPDLSAAGFPLLGGRVERVGGKAVAALAYARDRHIINVFVWPAGRPEAPQVAVRKGFNLQHWSDSAMQVWVVSDVEASEVVHFSDAWREQVISSAKTER
jgi:anti-sigma factor RsiW